MAWGRVGIPTALRASARIFWVEATPFVRNRLLAVVLLVVAAAVLTALGPVALKFIVDGVIRAHEGQAAFPLQFIVLYVGALWLARVATEIRGLVFAVAEQRIFRAVSERVFFRLMHLPLRFHLNRKTGAVSQTVDNGLEGLRISLHHLVFTYLPVTVEVTTVLLVLLRVVTPQFLILFFGALMAYVIAFGYSATRVSKAARRASAARVDATALMTDGLINYETVKYFTAESLVQTRVADALRRSESEWVGFHRGYALNGMIVAGIFAVFLAATVFYAAEEVQLGSMTVGDFVLVNMYMLQVIRPVELIGYATQGISHGLAMLEKLVQLFEEPMEPGPRMKIAAPSGPGSLEFQEVSVTYDVARPVLNRVSLRVAGGRTVGIVGPSGSGKSTLVRLLMRLLEPESGRILLDAVPIAGMALDELRGSIAVVPQDTALFDETVRFNIGIGRADASRREIEHAARVAQLHDFIMALRDGYETAVGERGVKLSGGERQRISIARAVLKGPKIYVFDEATSSLDSRTEQGILRSIRAVSSSKTTLIVAHRLSTVVHADEIIVLENGQIAEQGTHCSLLRSNGRYAALWEIQQNAAAVA